MDTADGSLLPGRNGETKARAPKRKQPEPELDLARAAPGIVVTSTNPSSKRIRLANHAVPASPGFSLECTEEADLPEFGPGGKLAAAISAASVSPADRKAPVIAQSQQPMLSQQPTSIRAPLQPQGVAAPALADSGSGSGQQAAPETPVYCFPGRPRPLWALSMLTQLDVDEEMFEWAMDRERMYQPEVSAMERQRHIDAGMRSILFAWMAEVSQEFCLGRETLHLSTNYVDRFLALNPDSATYQLALRGMRPQPSSTSPVFCSGVNGDSGSGSDLGSGSSLGLATGSGASDDSDCDDSDSSAGRVRNRSKCVSRQARLRAGAGTPTSGRSEKEAADLGELLGDTIVITRTNLQLLGVTCLFIASKAEEIFPPNAQDFAVTTDGAYTTAQIDAMERRVLQCLQWNLLPQTAFSWLKLFQQMLAKHVFDDARSTSVGPGSSPNFGPGPSTILSLGSGLAQSVLTMERIVDARGFARMMDLLDLALLDNWFLRFYPSAQAASVLALYLVYEQSSPVVELTAIKAITGYEPDQLLPSIAMFKEFANRLPFLGERPPNRIYLENLKIPVEDAYTRQVHQSEALRVLASVPTAAYDRALAIASEAQFLAMFYSGTAASITPVATPAPAAHLGPARASPGLTMYAVPTTPRALSPNPLPSASPSPQRMVASLSLSAAPEAPVPVDECDADFDLAADDEDL